MLIGILVCTAAKSRQPREGSLFVTKPLGWCVQLRRGGYPAAVQGFSLLCLEILRCRISCAVAASCINRRFASQIEQEKLSENPSRLQGTLRRSCSMRLLCAAGVDGGAQGGDYGATESVPLQIFQALDGGAGRRGYLVFQLTRVQTGFQHHFG